MKSFTKKILLLFLPVILCFNNPANKDTSQEEPALQKQWPEKGPELLWDYEGIGNGYSSVALSSDKLFITGETDSTGYLFAFDLQGKLLWKSTYGEEWTASFRGSRSRPVVAGKHVYVSSGLGLITCFATENGSKIWSVDMQKDLGGEVVFYGYSSDPIIHEDLLLCSPGGKENNVVALNRFSGELVWSAKALGQAAGHGPALLIELPARSLLVTFSEFALMGIDAKTGELLWNHKLADLGQIPCNAPVYEDGYIYYIAGHTNGAVKLGLSGDGSTITEIWKNPEVDTYFGGFVKYKNHIYTALEQGRIWKSIEANSGKIVSELNFHKGASIMADEMLYLYNERGQMALVKPEEGKMHLVSSFKISQGSKEHFAFPLIANGVLYIRHGNALMAYDIRQ